MNGTTQPCSFVKLVLGRIECDAEIEGGLGVRKSPSICRWDPPKWSGDSAEENSPNYRSFCVLNMSGTGRLLERNGGRVWHVVDAKGQVLTTGAR